MATAKPKNRVTRVVLAEPQAIFLQAALRALEDADDIEIVATARSAQQAIELIHDVVPDLAIVAVGFPDDSGLSVLEAVGEDVAVLMLSSEDSRESIFEAMTLGARGHLLKLYTDVDMSQAIRDVMRGELVMDAASLKEFVTAVRERFGRRSSSMRGSSLSTREREVLSLTAEGMSAPQIAEELMVSINTVRSHTRNAYIKLGVKNKTTAVREAIRLGLLNGGQRRR